MYSKKIKAEIKKAKKAPKKGWIDIVRKEKKPEEKDLPDKAKPKDSMTKDSEKWLRCGVPIP